MSNEEQTQSDDEAIIAGIFVWSTETGPSIQVFRALDPDDPDSPLEYPYKVSGTSIREMMQNEDLILSMEEASSLVGNYEARFKSLRSAEDYQRFLDLTPPSQREEVAALLLGVEESKDESSLERKPSAQKPPSNRFGLPDGSFGLHPPRLRRSPGQYAEPALIAAFCSALGTSKHISVGTQQFAELTQLHPTTVTRSKRRLRNDSNGRFKIETINRTEFWSTRPDDNWFPIPATKSVTFRSISSHGWTVLAALAEQARDPLASYSFPYLEFARKEGMDYSLLNTAIEELAASGFIEAQTKRWGSLNGARFRLLWEEPKQSTNSLFS